MPDVSRHPRWPWVIIVGFALIEPLTHVWLQYGLSGDVVHSGFHIGDTPFFLWDMQIFTNNFYSPYVVCTSAEGANNPWLYALPHHWMYATLGWLAHTIHLDPFLALGIANGLGGAFYLWMALCFFRYVIPARANLAFVLLCFGGGLGGLVWVASLLLGLQEAPGFEFWFHRFARYELIEGPFLAPALLLPRLYYTLPLGLGFAALMAFIGSAGREHPLPDKKAILLQFLCAYLNARVGLLFWGVALCFMIAQPVLRNGMKWRYVITYLLPTLVATMLMYIPFGMNPHGVDNFSELLRRSAWMGSLVTATFWAWPVVALVVWRQLGQLGGMGRLLGGWALGYGVVFFVLYVVHQTWYGNWLAGGDTAAAIAVSDWALLGLLPGSLMIFHRRKSDPEAGGENWVALWFLGLASLSIAALGHGWSMRLMPERCLVLLGPPLAMLLAEGLGMVRLRFPRVATVYTATIVVSGLVSLAVGVLCFQGPLGHTPVRSPFGWAHSEVVFADDLALINLLEHGRVLAPASAPPLLGDVAVAQQRGLTTVFGQPSLEFGDVNMLATALEVQRFFSPAASDLFRTMFVMDWCVDFILCPATRPVDPSVMAAFDALPWLERIAEQGDAVLYRVLIDTGSPGYV